MSDELPYLAEHQAPDMSTSPPPEYDAPAEERALVKKLEKMFESAKQKRAKYDFKWLDWYKMFRGKQWDDFRPSYRHSEVFNLIFQHIQSQVPILTDSRPKFEYLPQEPSDRPFAELMNDIAASEWQTKNYLAVLTEVIYEAHNYGTGISELVAEENPRTGELEIVYRAKDVFYFFPDGEAKSLKDGCRATITAEPMPIETVKRKYPKKAKYIRNDVKDTLKDAKHEIYDLTSRTKAFENPNLTVGGYQLDDDNDKVILICAYYRDEEFADVEQTRKKEDGSEEKYYEKGLKFPMGRKTVTANGLILKDGSNPYDDGEFPYQRLINYVDPHNFWGISEQENLEGPQKTFNKVVSFVLDVLTLMGNPIWIVDTSSGVDVELLTGEPGLAIEKEPNSEVRRETGVQLQGWVLQVIDKVKDWFDQLGGSQDITRGIPSGGVTAAAAIADLQNAAQTRIRQKSRWIDAYLQDLGQQFASRVMQFYTAPKVFRLTGKDGVEQFFRANFQKGPDGNVIARVQKYDEVTGAISDSFDEYQLAGKLDVRVNTGTALPFAKAQEEEKLRGLFLDGVIDDEEYLKRLQYPNYEAVIQRKREREAQQAAAQAQAKGAPVAG